MLKPSSSDQIGIMNISLHLENIVSVLLSAKQYVFTKESLKSSLCR